MVLGTWVKVQYLQLCLDFFASSLNNLKGSSCCNSTCSSRHISCCLLMLAVHTLAAGRCAWL